MIETTRRVIGERRLDVLRDLAVSLASARHVSEVLDGAAEVMSRHPSDLPAGLLRLIDPDRCEGDRVWSTIGRDDSRDALAEVAAEAVHTGGSVIKATDPPGVEYQPGAASVTAYPIQGPPSTGTVAVLAVDINRHVLFDDAYDGFLALVAGAIGAAIGAAQSYEKAEQRASMLEELDRAKTSFLSNVSHEFRTPLTLLLGPLHEYGVDDRLPEDVRRGLQLAERNARRLLKLVNNLLDFATLEAGRATASYEPTDLGGLTAEIASQFLSAATSEGLDLIIDCPSSSAPVYVDRDMWEQIVTNLCANALKYTPSGSVAVRLHSVGDVARLEVSDTGIGIPPDEIPFIFDRFRRARSVGARSVEGTGLGLALVRELVALHGGQVGVDSAVDAGSTFTVRVPVGAAHLPASQLIPVGGPGAPSPSTPTQNTLASLRTLLPGPSSEPTASRPSSRQRRAQSSGSVYVVDDNSDMRSYLCDLLARYWYVVAFANARAALDAIEGRPPDLIISDVMMPGMDGFSFLAELRSRPHLAQLPILLLSARAGEEAIVEGLEAGADDYLVKPFAARTLLARVRSHLDLAEMRRDSIEKSARHAAQLAFLATAASDILGAETIEDVATVAELSARQVTGADRCRFQHAVAHPGEPEHLDPPGRVMLVPVATSGGESIATLRLTHRSGRTFTEEDHVLVAELARIAARRIERIREYEQEHQVSVTLQRSLLPRVLPVLSGAELVTRYRPASEAAAVGGDWYDALLLPGGRLMLVVGDVIGHDLEAAVAMGVLRHLIRAHAVDSPDPAHLCQVVNRLLPAVGGGEMATATVAFLEPESGRLHLASAGHPPPIVVPPVGPPRILAVRPCPPLGALDVTEYHSVEAILEPAATLLLYTDGLVERRGESIDVSLQKLASRCHILAGGPLEAGLDQLLEQTLTGDSVTDDVAVLALRRQSVG